MAVGQTSVETSLYRQTYQLLSVRMSYFDSGKLKRVKVVSFLYINIYIRKLILNRIFIFWWERGDDNTEVGVLYNCLIF